MNVTIKQVLDAQVALRELADTPMPAVLSLRIALVLRTVSGPVAAYDDAYNKLITTLGVQPKGATTYNIPPAKREEFAKQKDKLLAEQITIAVDAIPVEHFDGVVVKPSVLLAVDWLIKLPEVGE